MLKTKQKNNNNKQTPNHQKIEESAFRPPIMFLFLDLKISREIIKSVAKNYIQKVYGIIQLVTDEKLT